MFTKAANGSLVEEAFIAEIRKIHKLIMSNEEIRKHSVAASMEACMSIIAQHVVCNQMSIDKIHEGIDHLHKYYSKGWKGGN